MSRKWTEAQSTAITAKGSNLLLAAAAGSGKTAVLVERIIKKITDEENPVDIDRLLVLTFTNAAASEMRERIMLALTDALVKNPDSDILLRQMTLLRKASITTIHSFCNDTLHSNFNAAGIDPNFRIADTTENELLRAEALDEVINEMYEDEEWGETFADLCTSYAKAENMTPLYELTDRIYSFCMSLPNPYKWLEDSCEKLNCENYKSFDETEAAVILTEEMKKEIRKIVSKYDYMIEKAEIDDGAQKLVSFLMTERRMLLLLTEARNYSDLFNKLSEVVFKTLPAAPKNSMPMYREEIKEMRDRCKKSYNAKVKACVNLSSDENMYVMKRLYPLMKCLSILIIRFSERFDEKKDKKNLLNFNDLEHKCLHLLIDEDGNATDIAETIKNKYDEILIDEYQDISRLQEAIFDCIKKENNMFCVGDLKQSIYRFRNTDPNLFKKKKELFSKDENALNRKIVLSKNFRSRKEILESVNFIFKRIMSDSVGEIEYDADEELYCGADYDDDIFGKSTEIDIIDMKEVNSQSEETVENVLAEAHLVAKRIAEIIKSKMMIKAKDGIRPVTYKDIAILMRSVKDRAEVFASVLTSAGIPCYSDKSGSLLESVEIEVIMSFLRIIDNPHQDIPLLCVLRSQIFAFTTTELAQIRIKERYVSFYDAMRLKAEDEDETGKKVKSFLAELSDFREKSAYMSVPELIWHIYMETGFYDFQGIGTEGKLKQTNLRLLYLKAGEYEKTGIRGLYGFITFIDKFKSSGGDYDAARVIGEEHNVVKIMSIHKSKGLEFPVVFVCGTAKQFNKLDLNKSVLFHPDLGFGPKYIDLDLGITYPNGIHSALRLQNRNEIVSEEMRILYVALTRAKEKLILVGAVSDLSAKLSSFASNESFSMKIESYLTNTAESYLDWVLMSVLDHPDGKKLRERIKKTGKFVEDDSRWEINIFETDENEQEFTLEESKDCCEDYDVGEMIKRITWKYPFEKDIYIPSKVSVTEMKSRQTVQNDETCVYLYPRPTFMEKNELTARERGIAFHTVMENLDFANTKNAEDIDRQINEMALSGVISETEQKSIDKEKILNFFSSDIAQLLEDAEKIQKEVMFAVYIPAKEAEKDYDGNAKIMLQGVMDCVIKKDDGIIIIDYKTDKITDVERTVEKYKLQLDLYERAAKILYKKTVLGKYLYLFDKNILLEL